MKNLKKVLALVLVVAMVMGLAITSNAAFKDASSIKHTEAVDVMSGIGVINGFTDGSFKPTDNVTRAQMAKMVTFILNKGTDVGSTYAGANTFTDCKSSWAKGYIAYASKTGIVAGVGNNKFNPDGSVTGVQAAKMLLCALGYDATVEQYTGANWAVNVLKDADDADLLDDLDGVDMSAALSRENAAQMMFNALKATMVDYESKGTTITINGATIATGASSAKAVARTSGTDYTGVPENSTTGTQQLCEKYFSKLVMSDAGNDLDNYGRPTTSWTFDSKSIGSYGAKTPVVTYTAEVKEKDVFTALGVDGISGSSAKYVVMDKIFEDGVQVATSEKIGSTDQYQAAASSANGYKETVIIAKGDTSNMAGAGNGVTVEIYKTDLANHYVMVCYHQFFGKVSTVTKATSGGDARKISLTLNGTANGTFETENFAKGDYVIATKSGNTIKTVVAAKKVENVAVTSYGSSSVTAAGTAYKYSQLYTDGKTYDMSSGSTYTLYLDANGYVIKSDTYSAGVTNAVYVVSVSKVAATDDFTTDYYTSVKYVDATGKVTTAKAIAKNETTAATDLSATNVDTAGNLGWFTVKNDSDNSGYVIFTKVAAYDPNASTTAGFVTTTDASDAKYTLSSTDATIGANDAVTANSNTTFVLRTDSNTYKVYTGIANVSKYVDVVNPAYAIVKDGYATTVYVDVTGLTASNSTDELVYLLSATADRTEYDATNKVNYSVYKALVDGTAKEIKVASGASGVAAGLVKVTAYDANNYVKTFAAVTSTTTEAPTKYVVASLSDNTAITYDGGTLKIGGTAYVVSSSAAVYMIDSDDNVTTTTADSLAGDVNGASHIYMIQKSDTDATIMTIYFDGAID